MNSHETPESRPGRLYRTASRALDWFGWNVLGGMPTGYRKPSMWLLTYGPYHWGMALYNRTWIKCS